ncbi:MAG TPA: hypothetical protein VIK18_12160 [Pirellulales bacterium]
MGRLVSSLSFITRRKVLERILSTGDCDRDRKETVDTEDDIDTNNVNVQGAHGKLKSSGDLIDCAIRIRAGAKRIHPIRPAAEENENRQQYAHRP